MSADDSIQYQQAVLQKIGRAAAVAEHYRTRLDTTTAQSMVIHPLQMISIQGTTEQN